VEGAIATNLWKDYCDDLDSSHIVPLVTHFLQGNNAIIAIDDTPSDEYDPSEGVLINIEVPLNSWAPITQYAYTIFTDYEAGESNTSTNYLSLSEGSIGRIDHGFVSTTRFLQEFASAYQIHEYEEVGYPDTILPTIRLHNNGNGNNVGSCNVDTSMELLRYAGCRPVPNGLLTFQDQTKDAELIVSGTDSSFVIELLGLKIETSDTGTDQNGATVVKIQAFVPQSINLVEEGMEHHPFTESERHYHWTMDCSNAVNANANADAFRTRLNSLGDGNNALFSLMTKGT
jgi:hypothetical protein